MNKKVVAFIFFCTLIPSSTFAQTWQVPLNTIPYGKGPGQASFGSVANTGSGTLCLLNTAPPSFGTCSGSLPTLSNGRIFVGNASNVATAVAMSGDCTIVAAGAITCTKTNGIAFGQATNGTSAAILSKRLSYGYWVDLDFGAVCDGTTNTATAINSAITQIAANGGGVLNFPAATCAISSTINLVQGVTINGQGPIIDQLGFTQPATAVSKIKWIGGGTGTMISTPAAINSNIGITNLTIDGQVAFGSLGTSALKGIKIGSGMGAKIQGVVVANVGHGISLEPGYGIASPPLISWGDYRNISMTYVGTGIDLAPNTTIGMTSGGVTNNNFYNIVVFEPVNYGLNFWALADDNHFHGVFLDTSTVGTTLVAMNTLDPTNPVGVYANSIINLEISCNDTGSGAGIHPLTVNNTNGFGTYIQGQFFNCEAPTIQNGGIATVINDVNPNYVMKAWKPLNGSTTISLQNPNAGSSAAVGIELGNNASAGFANILLNSSTNSALGGINSLNIANVNAFPVAISVNDTVRNKTTNTGVEITGTLGLGTSSASAQLHTTGTVRFAGLSGVGSSGCLGNDTSGNITAGNSCSGAGFPSGGVKGDLPYYSGAGAGSATEAPEANAIVFGADPTGAATSTAAAVLAYGYSKRVVFPPAPGLTTATYKFSTDITFPSGTELIIPCGVILAPDSGKFIRNLGVTKAGQCTIVGGAGTVYLGRDVKADWWPSTGGDDTIAINAADKSTNNASALSFTGSISTTTLTVTAVASGYITLGKPITGAGVTANTIVTALGTGTGEVGTYTVSISQTVGSEAMTGDSADGSENIIRLSCRTYTIATAIILHANLSNPQKLTGCGPKTTTLSASGGSFSRGALTQAGMTAGVGNDLMQFTWRDFGVTCSADQNIQGITLGTTTKAIRSYGKNIIERVGVFDCRIGIGWYNTRLVDLIDMWINVHGETTASATAIHMDFDDNTQLNGDSDIIRGQFACNLTSPSGGAGYGLRLKSEKSGSNISGIRVHGSVFYYCNKMVYGTWALTGTMGDHWFSGGVQCETCGNIADYAAGGAAASFTASMSTTTMTVTAVASGTIAVGQTILGSGITSGTVITALGSGSGGTGTYTINNSQTVGSEAMTTAKPKSVAMLRFDDIYVTGTAGQPYFRFAGYGAVDAINNGYEIVDTLLNNIRIRGGGGCASCRFAELEFASVSNITGNQLVSFEGSGGNPNELINLVRSRKVMIANNNVEADGISGSVANFVTAGSSSNYVTVTGNQAGGAVSATWNASSVSNECVPVTNLPHTALSGC